MSRADSIEDCRFKSRLFKDIFILNRSRVSQLVTLQVESKPISVLCQLGDFGCGDGGWTPVMKIDGSKVWHLLALILRDLKVVKFKYF